MLVFILTVIALISGAIGSVRVATGQTNANLEASRMHVAYDGTESTDVFVLSSALRLDRTSLSLDASGALSYFSRDWSAQAGVTTSYFTRQFGPMQGEIEAAIDGSMQPGRPGNGIATGGFRFHLLGENQGVWLGGRTGRASDGFGWRSITTGDLGGWIRYGGTTAVIAIAPSNVGGTLRCVDTYAIGHLEHGRLELFGSFGFRDWQSPAYAASVAWGSVNGALWLNDHLALAIGGGSSPDDYVRGFVGSTYITIGIRIATTRPTARQAISSVTRRTLPVIATPVTGTFRVQSATGNQWSLEVTAPKAHRVELMGDFTDWQPVPFQRHANGRWFVTLPITAGTHRMNLRVDGGAWGVPPGLPVLTDEFSGLVALLTVE